MKCFFFFMAIALLLLYIWWSLQVPKKHLAHPLVIASEVFIINVPYDAFQNGLRLISTLANHFEGFNVHFSITCTFELFRCTVHNILQIEHPSFIQTHYFFCIDSIYLYQARIHSWMFNILFNANFRQTISYLHTILWLTACNIKAWLLFNMFNSLRHAISTNLGTKLYCVMGHLKMYTPATIHVSKIEYFLLLTDEIV